MSEGQSAPDKLTLIVVPDEASPVRRYQISRSWLRRARWIGPLLAIMLIGLIGDYTRLRFNAVDMVRLRGEAEEREVRVDALGEEVADLRAELTRIRELERKVRIIANLPELPSQEAVPAVAPSALPGSGATAQTSVETAAPKRKAKPSVRTKAKPSPAKAKPAPEPVPPKAPAAPKPAAPKAKTAPKAPATTETPSTPAPKPSPKKPPPRPSSVAKPAPPPAPKPQPEDLGVPKPGEKPPQHLIIPREDAPRVPAAPLDGQGGVESDEPEPGDEVPVEESSDQEPMAPPASTAEGGGEEDASAPPQDADVIRILGSSAVREQLETEADLLAIELASRLRSLDELLTRLEGKSAQLASTPSIWPTTGWVTSPYGYRTSPFTGRRQFHSGLDIAAKFGTPVVAPATGRVVFAGRKGPMGKMVEIDHGYGISTAYGHLAEYFVKKGEFVERGQRIAAVGSTGRSTGPHLHYSVRLKRKHVNPANYIID